MVKNLPSPAAWLEMGGSSSLHSGQQANDLSTLIKTDFGNVKKKETTICLPTRGPRFDLWSDS